MQQSAICIYNLVRDMEPWSVIPQLQFSAFLSSLGMGTDLKDW